MDQMAMVRQAYSNGSYAMAYETCVGMIRNGSADGMAYMYRAMAVIAKADIDGIDIEEVKVDLQLAFERIGNDAQTSNEYYENATDALFVQMRTRKKVEEKYRDRLSALQSQFKGSTGISPTPDDPAERQREEAERNHNTSINRQIYRLNERYESIKNVLDEVPMQLILSSSWLQKTPGIIPLKLLDVMQSAVGCASDLVKAETLRFVKYAKAERNRLFWADHAEQHDALVAEKKALEQKIAETIQAELSKCELAIERAIQAKECATKERRRYSLFNFADRNPQTAIIMKAKAVIKRAKELEKELKIGKCSLCDLDRKRIAEINEELNKQR